MKLKRKKKENDLAATKHVALTGDHWTYVSNDNYLGVTAHLITNEWKLKSFTLTLHFWALAGPLLLRSHSFVLLAVCLRSLSCWEVNFSHSLRSRALWSRLSSRPWCTWLHSSSPLSGLVAPFPLLKNIPTS